MWALLDIRVGRANRIQFVIFILICVAIRGLADIFYPAKSVMPDPAFPLKAFLTPRLLFQIIGFYIFYLGVFRRCRDRGSTKVAFTMLAFNVFFILPYLIPPLFSIYMIGGYFAIMSGVSGIFSLVILAFLVLFTIHLFKSGDPLPNQYGYPPVGLILGTMTRATYPPKLVEKYNAQARERDEHVVREQEEAYQKRLENLYATNLKPSETPTTEFQEFKGRE